VVYAYCCGTELDSFEGVFNLEEAAFGGEGAVRTGVRMDRVAERRAEESLLDPAI